MSIRLWLCRKLLPKGWVAIPRQQTFRNSSILNSTTIIYAAKPDGLYAFDGQRHWKVNGG